MFCYDHGLSGWGWFAMSASTILFWAVIITAAVLISRALGRVARRTEPPDVSSAERALAERFTRGEIDEDEYRQRLATLHTVGSATKP